MERKCLRDEGDAQQRSMSYDCFPGGRSIHGPAVAFHFYRSRGPRRFAPLAGPVAVRSIHLTICIRGATDQASRRIIKICKERSRNAVRPNWTGAECHHTLSPERRQVGASCQTNERQILRIACRLPDEPGRAVMREGANCAFKASRAPACIETATRMSR